MYDLPRVHERAFRRYLARNRQYKQEDGSTKNPIPFPVLVSPDTAEWWDPATGKRITYNALHQGLVTAIERQWLPEAPEKVEASGETADGVATGESGPRRGFSCDLCGRDGFASNTGVNIHKATVLHIKPRKRRAKKPEADKASGQAEKDN